MLFKSNVEDFIARADIIKNTKIINKRICIAYSESEISNINVVIAKAADELLNIKNVEASFILGHKNDTVFISARSLGQINVHVLMEKLGGGGHIDIAGAQLKNVTLNQAYKQVHHRRGIMRKSALPATGRAVSGKDAQDESGTGKDPYGGWKWSCICYDKCHEGSRSKTR